jgi:CheY-like chemotaxis protein
MDPMKILLVDDSKSARYALRLQLQRHGVEVDTADSAESAFEVLKGELPDAILMDHMMPGLNGFEALEVIREDPRTAHLPVVMCTSHEDADFAAAAQRKGVVGILPKSGAPEKLPAILAKLRDTIEVPNLALGQAATARGPQPGAPIAETAGPARPPTGPASGGSSVDEPEILARLDERIATRITALLDDLRRDLSERLRAEVQRLLDSGLQGERQALDQRLAEQDRAFDGRLEAEHRALQAAIESADRTRDASASESIQAEIHALSERLSRDVLPSLVKVEIEAERGQIMELVAQYLREFGPRLREDGEREAQRLASLEEAVASKAAEIARREAQTAADAVLRQRRPQNEPAPPQPRPAMTGVYLAILAAALSGIGAAAAVYVLVS